MVVRPQNGVFLDFKGLSLPLLFVLCYGASYNPKVMRKVEDLEDFLSANASKLKHYDGAWRLLHEFA